MTIERVFSWNMEHEDREFLASTATDLLTPVAGLVKAPKLWSLSDVMEALAEENQGRIGSCAGHSLTTIVELCHLIKTGEQAQYSRAYGYYAVQKHDGLIGRDQGSTISGGVAVAKKHGIPLESVWPYRGVYDPTPPQGWERTYAAAEPHKIESHVQCRSYQDVYTFLGSGQGGIHIGINWNQSCEPGPSGLITRYQPGRGGGGHAVALPFLSTRLDLQDRPWIWLANSWGTQWGNHGYAEVSPDAINQMLRDGSTVMIGLSDLSAPAVRDFSFTDAWKARRNKTHAVA